MIAVTGANGHLGSRLLPELAAQGPVRALVRSERAADAVRGLNAGPAVEVRVVDYTDAGILADALRGCTAVVHLVGIIKETAANRYRDAHEAACNALVEGARRAGVERIVYLSILGAAEDSANACLASRGAAERILHESTVESAVIRVPMVLGEGDFAAAALAARARRGFNLVLRGASLEQPIYAGDVVKAVLAVLNLAAPPRSCDLAGPESLPRVSLIHRAARILGRRTRVVSVPLGVGLAAAWVMERLLAHPPVTRAMLGVLDHDDLVDTQPAVSQLALTLTPLDETMRRCIGNLDSPS